MNRKDCIRIGRLLASNFTGKIKIHLFGSVARTFKEGRNLDEVEFPGEPSDLDFFIEVNPEIFTKYCQFCEKEELSFNGMPYDSFSAYWDYHSPVAVRMDIVINEILDISSSREDLFSALNGHRFDVMMLPFDWQKDKKVLTVINSKDPVFSKSIEKDSILLFEKGTE